MRRTIVTLRHRAGVWQKRASNCTQDGTDFRAGLSAYAHSQADLLYALAEKYECLWTDAGADLEGTESDGESYDGLEEDLDKGGLEERLEEAEMGL